MVLRFARKALLAGLFVGLGGGAVAQDQAAGSVVVYTSNNQQSVQAVTDVGQKALPRIKINVVTGGSGVLLKRLEAEAAKPQGDIFWSAAAGTLGAFKHLYQPYRSPEAAAIPSDLREPNDLWTASNIHVAVLMVNRNQLGGVSEPKTWADLLDPRWKGKLIIADPANSSTGYTILWGLKQMLGSEGLKRLASNLTVTSAATTVLRAVGQGEYAVGLTFESNAYAYVAGGQKEIALIYPNDGTFTSPEFMVLVKNGPNPAAAKRAFDHLASKEVQVALLEAAFRRPSRDDIDVTKHADLPNLSAIKVFPLNEDEAARQRAEFLAEWQTIYGASR
jgi:iron(III) transport system substrate-binding protein